MRLSIRVRIGSLGIEGAASGGNIGGSTDGSPVPGDNATFKETTDFLTSVTGRVGYAWDRWLLYAKGGAAWAGDRYSAFDSLRRTISKDWRLGSAGPRASALNGRSGMIGRSSSNTTITASARRSVTFIDNISGTVGPEDIKQSIQVVKLGLNFHVFAWSAAAPSRW